MDADWARVPTLLNAESRGIHGSVCFRESRRQCEVECRAATAVAVGPDPAAMRLDDRLTDCQADAAALRLRRKDRPRLTSVGRDRSGYRASCSLPLSQEGWIPLCRKLARDGPQ